MKVIHLFHLAFVTEFVKLMLVDEKSLFTGMIITFTYCFVNLLLVLKNLREKYWKNIIK